MGSTRSLTDSTGTTQQTYAFDSFGNTTATTGALVQPFTFAGYYQDSETGFFYLRARYYNPFDMNFLTRDPIVQVTGDGYQYAGINPTNATDHQGLMALADGGAAYYTGASMTNPGATKGPIPYDNAGALVNAASAAGAAIDGWAQGLRVDCSTIAARVARGGKGYSLSSAAKAAARAHGLARVLGPAGIVLAAEIGLALGEPPEKIAMETAGATTGELSGVAGALAICGAALATLVLDIPICGTAVLVGAVGGALLGGYAGEKAYDSGARFR